MGVSYSLCLFLCCSVLLFFPCPVLLSIPNLCNKESYKLIRNFWLRFLISFPPPKKKIHRDKLRFLVNSEVAHSGPWSRWTLRYIIIYHFVCNTVMYLICRKRLTLESLILIAVFSNAMKVVQIDATQGQLGAFSWHVISVKTHRSKMVSNQEATDASWFSGPLFYIVVVVSFICMLLFCFRIGSIWLITN